MDTVNLPRVSDKYMYKLNLLYDVNLYNKAISKGKLLKRAKIQTLFNVYYVICFR